MMKVTEAFEMFVDEQLFRNNSPKTLIWYRENLGAFFRWLGVDSSIDDLTIFNYKAYCSYLLHEYEHNGKPLKSSSVNSHVRCVKAFYNFCIQEDLIPDFSRKLKTTKVHKTEKLPLDDEEINLLLQSFGDTVLERRNFCWVVLMCDSGLRRGEILSLIKRLLQSKHRSHLDYMVNNERIDTNEEHTKVNQIDRRNLQLVNVDVRCRSFRKD